MQMSQDILLKLNNGVTASADFRAQNPEQIHL